MFLLAGQEQFGPRLMRWMLMIFMLMMLLWFGIIQLFHIKNVIVQASLIGQGS
jgi:uncharacterized membrane protein